MSYILDTNALSEWRKTAPNRGMSDWFSTAEHEELYVSVVTIGEIRRGVTKLQLRNDHAQAATFESWLASLKSLFADRMLPVSVEIAEEWGNRSAYRSIPVPDGLIAATANVHGHTVVTRNVKDFAATGVKLVNPFSG